MNACEPLRERWITPHALCCDDAQCREPIAWCGPHRVTPGVCDRHQRTWGWWHTVPITIYGHGGVGWCEWPMSLRVFAQLRGRGAFDESLTRIKPVEQWADPPTE